MSREGQELRSQSSLTSSTSGRYGQSLGSDNGGVYSPHSIPEEEDNNVAGNGAGRSDPLRLRERTARGGARMVTFEMPEGQAWDGSGGGAGSSDGQGGVSFPRSMADSQPGGLALDDPAELAAGIPTLWNPARVFDRVQYGRSFRFLIDGADNKLNPGLTVNVKVPVKAYTEVSRSANFLWMVMRDTRGGGGGNVRPRLNTALIGMLERLETLRMLLGQHDLSPPPLPPSGDGEEGEGGEGEGAELSSHLAILTTPGGRRTAGGAATQGHSAAFIYGVDVASGGGAVACSPSCAAQTIHQAEVAVTALALSEGEPDTVAMTFSFFPLGFLFYLLRGGSNKDAGSGSINGNVIRGVMRGAIMGNLNDAEYEVGLYKLNPVLTRRLKAPGFNP